MRMCGLVLSTFDSRPVPSTGFSLSYSTANEWCAGEGAATPRTARTADRIRNVLFIDPPPRAVLRACGSERTRPPLLLGRRHHFAAVPLVALYILDVRV